MNNETYIWKRLKEAGYSDVAAAGIMGNLQHESGLRPNNLQNAYEIKFGMTDEEYTEKVNSGEYSFKQFVYDKAGYGLAQWTYWSRKQAMYNDCFPTIGSLEKQTNYLIKELSWYTSLQAVLSSAKTIRECSDAVLHLYECPGDQSERIELIRYNYAVEIFNRQTGSETKDFYTWQLNAYKVLDNAKAFLKTVKGGFLALKDNGYYIVCVGVYDSEDKAGAGKDTAKGYNKKAFIVKLTKEDLIK